MHYVESLVMACTFRDRIEVFELYCEETEGVQTFTHTEESVLQLEIITHRPDLGECYTSAGIKTAQLAANTWVFVNCQHWCGFSFQRFYKKGCCMDPGGEF